MKISKYSVPEFKQAILDSYITKVTPDAILEVKENSKGRGQGVFVTRFLINGNVDFYFRYFINEKEKSIKIGRYGKTSDRLTLAKAKVKFRELSTIYQSGIDPKAQAKEIAQKLENEEKIQREIERKKQMQGNIGQLSKFYLAHLKQNKGKTHYRNVRNAFEKDLLLVDPETKASDITKKEILKILHVITERNAYAMADKMRSYLSAMFNYGINFDDTSESITHGIEFFIESNPVSKVPKIKIRNICDRFLSDEEVKIFWRALENSSMSILRINSFKLMLLSGARVGEIAGLRWKEIDLNDRTINLPSQRTKNNRAHVIPINESMFKVINSHPKMHDVYLFPAHNNQEPLKTDGFSQAISRLLKRTKIDKFTPRDLRRTFKTLTGKAGISIDIRDRLQNHSLKSVSNEHYDRYEYLSEKRAAMDKWNDFLTDILNKDCSER